MDIKTVLIVPPRTLHAHAVSEWKANPQLSSIAAHEYDWDESLLVQSGPPDYFLTAIGEKKDPIFQGILMGRQQHPAAQVCRLLRTDQGDLPLLLSCPL